MRMTLTTEDDPRVSELRLKLDGFYERPVKYAAFEYKMQILPDHWAPIVKEIQRRVASKRSESPIRVLEFGAGRTGFGTFVGDLRKALRFEVQDVTPYNHDYLLGQADQVHICDLSQVKGPYDIIFSTYVFEHICSPRKTLEQLLKLLAPGGAMFIAAPRYGFPLYVPPSARHYTRCSQLIISAWLSLQRLAAMIDRKPRFWIHTDPAVFRGPWFRDADAIHWVSLLDIKLSIPHGYSCERVRIKAHGWRHRLWEMCMLAYVRVDKLIE